MHTPATTQQCLGHSREGREIGITFYGSEGNALRPGQRLDTLFLGAFHGDEGISAELLQCFQQFLSEASWDALALNGWFAVVPVVNPDGLARNTRQNAAGVDLNRNFPTGNWEPNEPGDPYYAGPSSASEPETVLIQRLLDEYPPNKIVTIHSPYRVVNFDGPEPQTRQLADAMAAHNGYEVVASIGYPTPGSFGTYCGIERGIPTITLELPEDEPLEIVWRDNREALLAALRFESH
jgi:protein MpaA